MQMIESVAIFNRSHNLDQGSRHFLFEANLQECDGVMTSDLQVPLPSPLLSAFLHDILVPF